MLCKVCGSSDPLLFYVSNKSKCKECVKIAARKHRVDNIDRYTAYEKTRASLPKRVKARAEYAKTEKGIEAGTRAKKKYIEQNPKKRSVHIIVGNAIRDGHLVKQNCEVCYTNENIVAHHCDYDKPLSVNWLCAKHHSEWHSLNGEGLNAN